MTSIGIDKHNGLVYEGDSSYGRVIWPTPVVTPAMFISEPDGALTAERTDNPFGYRFREDFYDPVSRIRRGRFYFADGSQPREWFIQPHPAMLTETKDNKHDVKKSLETCGRASIWDKYLKDAKEQPLVLLGTDSRFTIWTIINIEVISTGEEFITMKARSTCKNLLTASSLAGVILALRLTSVTRARLIVVGRP